MQLISFMRLAVPISCLGMLPNLAGQLLHFPAARLLFVHSFRPYYTFDRMEGEKIEQTLYQCRQVQVYRIPPRPSSGMSHDPFCIPRWTYGLSIRIKGISVTQVATRVETGRWMIASLRADCASFPLENCASYGLKRLAGIVPFPPFIYLLAFCILCLTPGRPL